MSSLSRVTYFLDRLIVVTLKALIVALLIAYGGNILVSRMHGFLLGSYQIAHVYTFDRIAFTCGETALTAENGSLITAERGGEENYAVLEGDIRVEWPENIRKWDHVPPQAIRRLRMSLNAGDLRRMIERNRETLRELLEYESDAIYLRQRAEEKAFEIGTDRFRPLLFPQLEFFWPPPEGALDLAILEDGEGAEKFWTLRTGPCRSSEPPSAIWDYVSDLSMTLFLFSPLLIAVLVAAGALACVAHAAVWAGSLIREPALFADAPFKNSVLALVVLLTAGALVSVILFV